MSSQGPPSTSTTSVPSWLSDYGQGLLSAGAQAAQLPYVPYTGQRVAPLSNLQQQALGGFSGLGQAAIPYLGQAGNTLSADMSGSMDPYTQQVIDRMQRGVTDQYNNAVGQTSGRFNSAGNWGSARQGIADELNQRALATGLGDAEATALSGAYENSQNRALQSVGALGGLINTGVGALSTGLTAGAIPQQYNQNLDTSLYNDFLEQRQYPWTQLQNAASLLGIGRSGAGSTTTQVQGYDPLSQGLGLYQLGSQKGGSGGSSKGGDGSATSLAQLEQFGNMGPGTYG